MERMVGTVARGLRAPIIREGDDLEKIVIDTALSAAQTEGYRIQDHDILCITEAIVARAQGNYATTDQMAKDIRNKMGSGTIGVIFPILSRNRFSICLKAIARGAEKVVLMLSYPGDEVGNNLIDLDSLDEKGIDPYRDVLTLKEFEDSIGIKTCFYGCGYV